MYTNIKREKRKNKKERKKETLMLSYN